jgi:hypothetical protein
MDEIRICKVCNRTENDGIKFNGKRRVCNSCNSKKSNEKLKQNNYFKIYYVAKQWYKPKGKSKDENLTSSS